MLKLGILDFDTSHVVEFTKRLNHKQIAEDQWVDGAEIVLGCPGESAIMPERIPGYTKEMEKLGVRLVDKPEEMIGKVDGMLIESQEGAPHWERARPFLEAGLPCFIDKPFTCSVADARKIVKQVYIDEKVKEYIVDVVFATREPQKKGMKELAPLIEYGASPRASIALNLAARAHAFLRHRGYVTPEDVKAIGPDVLRHRVVLSYEAEAEEVTAEDIVRRVFEVVEVP